MISYTLKENGIFWVVLSESIELIDITNYLKDFKKFDFLPRDLKLFYDLRDANLKLTAEDVATISVLAGESTMDYASIKTAFFVKEVHATAYAYLFAEQPGNTKGVRKVFSTIEAALRWLNSEPGA